MTIKSSVSVCSIIFMLVGLIGCATLKGPLFDESSLFSIDGTSKVVGYRVWSGTGAAWANSLFLDGKEFASLDNGGFGYTHVIPGRHTISYGSKSDPEFRKISIILEEGETYYVELVRGFPDTFRLVEKKEAQEILISGKFRLQELKKIP